MLVCLPVSLLCVHAQTAGGPASRQVLNNNGVSQSPLAACLPPDIKLADVVEATSRNFASGETSGIQKVTVEQKLRELKATCNKDNKLVDGNGRQIAFYHLTGCWGNPPYNYQEILQKQREELEKLKEQFTVIEMTCNPSGVPMQ